MKIQIRQSVFETNSSSMHSLVVKNNSEYYTQEELDDSMCVGDDGVYPIWQTEELEFGRYPFKCLTTFKNKLMYAIASMCGRYSCDTPQKTFNEILKTAQEIYPKLKEIELPHSRWSDSEDLYYGYVDEDLLTDFLKEENITLKEFLSNKKYVVIIDGDEYCIWTGMKHAGLVDKQAIESEYPRYKYYEEVSEY